MYEIIILPAAEKEIQKLDKSKPVYIYCRSGARSQKAAQKMAEMYCDKVKPYFEIIREHCDKLELLVDDEIWTLTKYRELLFTR